MRLSYITKLQTQGLEIQNPAQAIDFQIPTRVRSIIQNKFYQRPKSSVKMTKQQKQKDESFWISPLKNKDAPEVIHKNKSQPKKNIYILSIHDLAKQSKKTSVTPNRLRLNSKTESFADNLDKNIIQGISKSITNKYSTPKCRLFTEPDQIDNNNNSDSFLDVLQSKTGIKLENETLLKIYCTLPIEITITQQREIVKNTVLKDNNLIEKKNQQTSDWINKMSPTLKKQILEDKQLWYPSTKLNKQSIKKDIDQIFGVGNLRILKPGEEAAILEFMIQILESNKNILKTLKTDIQEIIKQILQFQQLEYLQQFSLCMKQILYHWQIFVTKLLCMQYQREDYTISNQDLICLCKRGHALDFRKGKQSTLAIQLLNYLQK